MDLPCKKSRTRKPPFIKHAARYQIVTPPPVKPVPVPGATMLIRGGSFFRYFYLIAVAKSNQKEKRQHHTFLIISFHANMLIELDGT